MKTFLLLTIKITLSILIFWALFHHIDIAPAWDLLKQHPGVIVSATTIFLLQSALAGLRMPLVMSVYDEKLDAWSGIKLWLVGLFTSQTMATFVAGDAFRVWLLRRKNVGLLVAAKAILFDRLFGMAVLLTLCLLGTALLLTYPLSENLRHGLFILGFLSLGLLVGFLASPLILKLSRFLPSALREHDKTLLILNLLSIAETGFKHWRASLYLALLGAIMHFLNAVILYMTLTAFGEQISLFEVTLLTFPIMLLTLLPISFAGWGMREGAMVTGFALFSIAPSSAIAASLVFGFALLLSSLPGAIFLFQALWKKTPQ